MADFRKGDVCSLEVRVAHQDVVDEVIVVVPLSAVPDQEFCVPAAKLSLASRAPVDLATCELPVDVVRGGTPALMRARHGEWAFIEYMDAVDGCDAVTLDKLRPADAPAPAAPPDRIRVAQDAEGFWTCREAVSGSQEYIRADLAPAPAAVDKPRLEAINAAGDVRAMMTFDDLPLCAGVAQTISEWADTDQKRRLRIAGVAPATAAEAGEVERLRAQIDGMTGTIARLSTRLHEVFASTAPSCPPGHVLINGHVVPEPMREGV